MSLLHFTDESFKTEVLDYKGVVLVDFWAIWCPPCRAIGPDIEELATEMEGRAKVGKINIEEESSLAQEYEIMSIPVVYIFKNGEIVEKIPDAQAKNVYKEALERYL